MVACLVALVSIIDVADTYRIDLARCATWPPRALGFLMGYRLLFGIALLSLAWLAIDAVYERAARGPVSTGARPPGLALVLAGGALVHLVALIAPPFLSDDQLAYAALGRAMGIFHHDPITPLGVALPLADPFHAYIAEYPGWLLGGSAYEFGYDRCVYELG